MPGAWTAGAKVPAVGLIAVMGLGQWPRPNLTWTSICSTPPSLLLIFLVHPPGQAHTSSPSVRPKAAPFFCTEWRAGHFVGGLWLPFDPQNTHLFVDSLIDSSIHPSTHPPFHPSTHSPPSPPSFMLVIAPSAWHPLFAVGTEPSSTPESHPVAQ